MSAPEFTDTAVDWDSPSWGGVVHMSSAGAMDAEPGDDQ